MSTEAQREPAEDTLPVGGEGEEPTPTDSSNDWQDMVDLDDNDADESLFQEMAESDDDEGGDSPADPPVSGDPGHQPAAEDPQATPQEPTPEDPNAAQPAEEPAPQPEEPPAEEPPAEEPEPQPEEPSAVSEEERARQYQQYLGELETFYTPSEEDVADFQDDPRKALAKLSAKLHANLVGYITETQGEALQHLLPSMIESVQTQRSARDELWSEFQNQWDDLTGKEYHPHIQRATELYFQDEKNFSKSREEQVREIGMNAWMLAGKNPSELVARFEQRSQSSEPTSQTQAPPQPAAGFQPAPTGPRTSQRQPSPGEGNDFAQLTEEILRGDFDDED